jgi:hypothetical protein
MLQGAAPWLVTEEGLLAEEVGLEEVVHFAAALLVLDIHHRLALLDDVEIVASLALSYE